MVDRVTVTTAQRRVLDALAAGARLHRWHGDSAAVIILGDSRRVTERTWRPLLKAGLIVVERQDACAIEYRIADQGRSAQ